MSILKFLKHRHRTEEVMDDVSLDPRLLSSALTDLAFLNRLSFAFRPFVNASFEIAKAQNITTLKICDVACGSADVLCEVIRRLSTRGVDVTGLGLDINEQSLNLCRARAETLGINCTFEAHNALQAFPGTLPDLFICSLFLHHLEHHQVVSFLKMMADHSKIGFLVTDLIRSPLGYVAAWAATRMFCSSPVVLTDSLKSVEGAFTIEEIRELASEAGLVDFKLQKVWPERFLLQWTRV